jgi:UDPglucose 6-dehydrogenase
LVTGVVLADLGNDVICVDKDPGKLERLRQGIPTIYEPGLEELMKRAVAEGFLRFSDSTAEAARVSDVVFIAVGTPPGEDGTPDLSAVRAVAADIAKGIDKPTVVVNKSTVPVGSGDLVCEIIRSQGVSDELFDVVSNPEFLREGSAIRDTLNPDRIVIGAKRREAAVKLIELYAPLERPMIITDVASAELIKYASNSFLAMKISFINAVSRMCELCDANVVDVAKGMGTDSRIGPQFLQAGLGWGGSCFPKDVQGMIKVSESLGYDFGLLREVVDINEDQTRNFLRRLETRLGGFEGKTIGLLGLAFKPNTDDIRDAKSLIIIEEILSKGGTVQAHDPVAADAVAALYPQVKMACGVYEVGDGADALVLVTEWNEFRQLDLARLGQNMRSRILFDGRRVYNRAIVERAGFEYFTVGAKS